MLFRAVPTLPPVACQPRVFCSRDLRARSHVRSENMQSYTQLLFYFCLFFMWEARSCDLSVSSEFYEKHRGRGCVVGFFGDVMSSTPGINASSTKTRSKCSGRRLQR